MLWDVTNRLGTIVVILVLVDGAGMSLPAQSQMNQGARPEFEVASIKPCQPNSSKEPYSSPGRLTLYCQTLRDLIQQAYDLYASGKRNPLSPMIPSVPIEGGPAWMEVERYTIDAKTEGEATHEMMRGPMMRALLEKRFQLEIRRLTREAPVYALVVAKGGSKLRSTQEDSCVPRDLEHSGQPLPPGKFWCGISRSQRRGPNVIWEARGLTLDAFSRTLGLDRPVVNRTGIGGTFDFRIESAPEEPSSSAGTDTAEPADPRRAPSIFTALQEQLGLKLEPAKGLAEFLVVDHAVKPSEN